MFKFVVIWALAQTINVSPPSDPYSGVVPDKALKESTIRIMYKSFKTKKEAEDFMAKAPTYIHEHMHLEDMSAAKSVDITEK